jgi:hypothetical protein
MPDVLIAGLTLRVMPEGERPYLGGPVLAAAAGSSALGLVPSCRTAIGNDLTVPEEQALARLCGPGDLARIAAPQPRLHTSARMGESPGQISRDEILRFAYPTHPPRGSFPIILVNGDPARHLELIGGSEAGRPILVDCYRDWLVVRQQAMAACIRASHIVTATEAELTSMPEICRQAIGQLLRRGGILVRKKGAAGIVVEGGGEILALPAPKAEVIVTDVGAGDLLAGAFAEALSKGPVASEHVATAYMAALPALTDLLAGVPPETGNAARR